MGVPQKWMVYPIKWMMTGGSPICGNPHIVGEVPPLVGPTPPGPSIETVQQPLGNQTRGNDDFDG